MSNAATNAIPPADAPKSLLDRIGVALPVALTALATAFAGLSTGELHRAMFWRTYAAQDQAKATSQWTLAGFKRDRALICQVAAAQLRATGGGGNPFAREAAGPQPADPVRPADAARPADWLADGSPPPAKLPDVADEALADLLAAVRTRAPEAELVRHAQKVSAAAVNAAIDAAEKSVEQTDRDWDPTLKAAAKLAADGAGTPTGVAAQAAGFELDRRRYQIEAGLNQGVGFLYEARIKVSSAESDKHQRKSKNFFYAMLAAQVGATVAALALARQKQSLLWAVAGGTGLVALVIGASVYLSDL